MRTKRRWLPRGKNASAVVFGLGVMLSLNLVVLLTFAKELWPALAEKGSEVLGALETVTQAAEEAVADGLAAQQSSTTETQASVSSQGLVVGNAEDPQGDEAIGAMPVVLIQPAEPDGDVLTAGEQPPRVSVQGQDAGPTPTTQDPVPVTEEPPTSFFGLTFE